MIFFTYWLSRTAFWKKISNHSVFSLILKQIICIDIRANVSRKQNRSRDFFREVNGSIGGFHVTQVSLIITQVKNKIAYHSINWVKKLQYRRRVINKQRAKVPGMCDIPNSSYSAKGFTKNYRVLYGNAMLEPVWGTPTWRPETSGNIWSLLWFSQNVYSLC